VAAGLLERIVRREPLLSEGKSGSRLERAWLDDGSVVVVKHADATRDWIMQATGDDGRIASLWEDGFFQRLPTSVEHAVRDVVRVPSGAIVVMTDMSACLFNDGVQLRAAHRRVLHVADELHRAFADRPGAALCPLRACYAFLSPSVCTRFAADHEVPRMAIEGWSRFHEVVATDVAEAIGSIHADPGPLADALSDRTSTLVHGDLKLANLGVDRDRVVVLDWGTLTTWAPPAVEYAWYLAINAAAIGQDHDQLLNDVRLAAGGNDDIALDLALVGGLAQLGWEKALGATADDPETRRRESDGLAWWTARVRKSLELWSP
jgi:hypothetical protein